MLHIHSNRSSPIRKSNRASVVALLFMCAFHSASLHAEDAAAFRSRVIHEVLQEVTDVELAKQIVEIRLSREFLKPQSSNAKPAPREESHPKKPNENWIPSKQVEQGNGNRSSEGLHDIYVGAGNRVVSHAPLVFNGLLMVADRAGLPTRELAKPIDGHQSFVSESIASLGSYFDWFVTEGDFKFSLGFNANRTGTKPPLAQVSNANLNWNTFNAGAEVLDFTHKFPIYTPYLGLEYQSALSDNGLSIYADLGLIFGKYDAHARTSTLGLHTVTTADVDAEFNKLRGNLFRWSYVTVGAVGIKYKF